MRSDVYTDTDLVLLAFAVTVQRGNLTVFVHHGYPLPLTHQISHRICTDLKINPGEVWGATAAAFCPTPRGYATDCVTFSVTTKFSVKSTWIAHYTTQTCQQ